MSKRKKLFSLSLLFCLLLTSWQVLGQQKENSGAEEAQINFEDILKSYRSMHDGLLKSLMDDKGMEEFEGRMRQMFEDIEKMHKDDSFVGAEKLFENFFQGSSLRDLLNEAQVFQGMESGQFDWSETPNECILIAKIEQDPGAPLDIEIKDAQITFKGESRIERKEEQSSSVQVQRFHRSFAIPQNCDPETAQFENEQGQVIVRFAKRAKDTPKLPEKRV